MSILCVVQNSSRLIVEWQGYTEGGAGRSGTFDGQSTMMFRDYSLGNRETKAGPGSFPGKEWLEDQRQIRFAYSGAVVMDGYGYG
jgi:hypothetical protein